MNKKIIELLKQIVAVDSITGTSKEQKIEAFLQQHLHSLPYFKEHPELAGLSAVPNDPYERSVVYGLVLGKSKKTVIFINHHDVVDINCYGDLQDIAYDMDKVTAALKERSLDAEAQADFASGDWLGGRGSNDMKGGMAAQLIYLEDYAKNPSSGSILFLSVPDEESFSWGMRHGIKVLQELKEKYSLDYRLCINSEPNRREGDKQVVPVGSVGKLLPFVVLQGKSTHVSEYAHGLSPMGLLAGLVAATEGNHALEEKYEGETTIAPVWMHMRDCKRTYDFSLPARAVGYCSVQTFQKSPQEIIDIFSEKLREVLKSFAEQYPLAPQMPILSSRELINQASEKEDFLSWNEKELAAIKYNIYRNGQSYPDETLKYVQELLDYLNYTEPVAVIGFAPPYYPATNSKLMDKPYFEAVQEALARVQKVSFEPYFLGVSDCSYCGITTKDKPQDYQNNTPLWGELYSFEATGLVELQIPFMLLGPWGKNLHEITERVNVKSLTEELPRSIGAVTMAAWK